MDARINRLRLGFGVTLLNRCLWQGGVDGIGSYTLELLKAFSRRSDIDTTPLSFGTAMHAQVTQGEKAKVLARFEVAALVSMLTGRPFAGASELSRTLDIVHATDHRIPQLGQLPVVATLMDAIPLVHPEWVSASRLGRIKHAFWRRSAHWADHVITISEYSKTEIMNHFGLPEDRISVTPLGVDTRWFYPLVESVLAQVSVRLSLPNRYFLFVGTLQPRKNVSRLIAAYQSLPNWLRDEVALLIVGRAGWQCEDITSNLESGVYGSNVKWLKHLPEEELLTVMKGATGLVFPSLYEGFGLPVLEAFAAGVPVVTSNTTSLPEVAGDAALLINPLDETEIAGAMQRIIEDTSLANSLRQRGLSRALEFTWDRTAEMTIDVYRDVLAR